MGRDHKEWLKKEFEGKYLRPSYRNVIIHTSFIEGVTRRESGKSKFELANKRLLEINKITEPEFEIFEKIRILRNSIIHDIFLEELNEETINGKIENLMKKIIAAYCISNFLKENLIKPYGIKLTIPKVRL